jgi:hypothetical protein
MLTAEVLPVEEDAVELFDEPWFKISPSQFSEFSSPESFPNGSWTSPSLVVRPIWAFRNGLELVPVM